MPVADLICEWCGWGHFTNLNDLNCRACGKPLNNLFVELIELGLIDDFRRPMTRQMRRAEIRLNAKTVKAVSKRKIPWQQLAEDL